jgi:excisionase family DNA binding protein
MQVTISGEFLSVDEVAKLANLQPISVYSLIRRKTLPATRIGKTLLVRKSDVERLVQDRRYSR